MFEIVILIQIGRFNAGHLIALAYPVTAEQGKPAVETLATKLSGKEFAAPEVVVFEDARKKSRRRKELEAAKNLASHANVVTQNKVTLDSDDIELSMKQTRYCIVLYCCLFTLIRCTPE